MHAEGQDDCPAQPPGAAENVQPALLRVAFRLLWNHDDAEDAVQDALALALRHKADLRDRSRWIGWVTRIVVHQCRAALRRRRVWVKHEPRLRRAALSQTVAEPATPPQEHLHSLRAALAKLPQRQYEVIVLRYLENLSYERIAELLDMAPSTARVQARTALERLRTLLAADEPTWFEWNPSLGEGGAE